MIDCRSTTLCFLSPPFSKGRSCIPSENAFQTTPPTLPFKVAWIGWLIMTENPVKKSSCNQSGEWTAPGEPPLSPLPLEWSLRSCSKVYRVPVFSVAFLAARPTRCRHQQLECGLANFGQPCFYRWGSIPSAKSAFLKHKLLPTF